MLAINCDPLRSMLSLEKDAITPFEFRNLGRNRAMPDRPLPAPGPARYQLPER
jgi:hypothetical protein